MTRQIGLSFADAERLFSYDPDTGVVMRRVRLGTYIAGTRAGGVRGDGYRYISVRGRQHLEHRICWLLHYGAYPALGLDHVNTNKADNRIVNLRQATDGENGRNKAKQTNNTSGFKGVTFNKAAGKYQARITCGGVTTSLGYFRDAECAALAYSAAAADIHGSFARTS